MVGFEPSTFVPLLCRKDPQPFQRTETRSSLKQRNSSVKDLVKKLESATSGKSETNLKAAASFDNGFGDFEDRALHAAGRKLGRDLQDRLSLQFW